MPRFTERLQHAWNAFRNNRDPTEFKTGDSIGITSWYRPDRIRYSHGNERSITNSIYTRIAVDTASIKVRHVTVDQNGRYLGTVDSHLNKALTIESNLDQTGRAFMEDVVMSMLDDGVVAVVPTDTTLNPEVSGSYDIVSLRVGKITQWYPKHVRALVYNENTGRKEELLLPKSVVAIIENPFYAVMNEPNSIAQRLIRKLNLLDVIDEQSASGKMDLIIQLPNIIRTEARQAEAEKRRKKIEEQLTNSKYGIAYIDGTEKIIQLNRPIENNLMSQIEYLTDMLYSQLGITKEIMDGTANEQVMLNYNNHTIEPIISSITEEFTRKFLTKTARTQGKAVGFFSDPFRLVPISKIADIADRFTRNEILTPNEVRGIIGFMPSDDPNADMLRNRNISMSNEGLMMDEYGNPINEYGNPVNENGMPVDEYGNPIQLEDQEIQNGS